MENSTAAIFSDHMVLQRTRISGYSGKARMVRLFPCISAELPLTQG